MNRKIRLIILISLVLTYFIVAPILIYYALGYRFDFDNQTVVSTGGFYLKIWPQEANILIDQEIVGQTNVFSNEKLIRSLLPKKYNIAVQKEGYFGWDKNLDVEDKKITKLENITLIKKTISFAKIKDDVVNIFLSPNENLILIINYPDYSFSLLDSQSGIIKNTFFIPEITKANISNVDVFSWNQNLKTILLKLEGEPNEYFSVDYNKTGVLTPTTIILKKDPEDLVTSGNLTFKKQNSNIYLLDKTTLEYEPFYKGKGIVFSNDKLKFLFFSDHEILFANTDTLDKKIFLMRFSGIISDCFWLNNNYIIYNINDNIKISEIDTRDKINTVDLQIKLTAEDNSIITPKNPKIFFDGINKNLYILNEKTLFVSEPLTSKNNR